MLQPFSQQFDCRPQTSRQLNKFCFKRDFKKEMFGDKCVLVDMAGRVRKHCRRK